MPLPPGPPQQSKVSAMALVPFGRLSATPGGSKPHARGIRPAYLLTICARSGRSGTVRARERPADVVGAAEGTGLTVAKVPGAERSVSAGLPSGDAQAPRTKAVPADIRRPLRFRSGAGKS